MTHYQQQLNKTLEELYETKPFIAPNGGDIKKVEITYEDWIWIENFLSNHSELIKKAVERDMEEKIQNHLKTNTYDGDDAVLFRTTVKEVLGLLANI